MQPATPCLVFDVDRVEAELSRAAGGVAARAHLLRREGQPGRADPRSPGAGWRARFDAASIEEIEVCLAAGADAGDISFGNTVKKVSAHPARASTPACRMFAFDSATRSWRSSPSTRPGARVYCRILVENEGADWPLSPQVRLRRSSTARDLMVRAAELGLDPYGLSFHVGSQQTSTRAYEAAIAKVGMLFTDLKDARREAAHGEPRRRLPGALPRRRAGHRPTSPTPSWRAMTEHFGNALPEMLVEPGRFIVGDAGVVSAEVVLVSRKAQGRSGALGLSRHRPLRRPGRDRGRGDQVPHRARRMTAAEQGPGGDRRPDLRRRRHPVREVELPPADGAATAATGSSCCRPAPT